MKKNIIRLSSFSLLFAVMMMLGIVKANALTSGDFTYDVNSDGITVTITGYSTTGPKDVVIPNTIDEKKVTVIGDSAFRGCYLTSVTIPDSVRSIEGYAFTSNCLTELTIPNSVTSIGESAFSNNKLTNVIIPNSVTTIGQSTFENNKLTSVIIPDSVTSIGKSAFSYNQLTSAIIPGSVTSIGQSAFENNQLTSVTIPGSVTSIGKSAFLNNLLAELTISNGVTSIGMSAFANNLLTKVVIPNSVTTIGREAFFSNMDIEGICTLKRVIVYGKDTTIGEGAFSDNYDFTENFEVVFLSSATIYGYAGSTSETYANGISQNFISLKDITKEMIDIIPTQYYGGSALTPTIVIKDGETTLTEGTDYEISYEDNDAAGTGKVIVAGLGSYEYSEVVEKTFTIKNKIYTIKINPVAGTTISPNGTINVEYGDNKEITITANLGYKLTSVKVNDVEQVPLTNNKVTLTNITEDKEIIVTVGKIEYEFTEGNGQNHTIGTTEDAAFKVNGDKDLFLKLYLNDEELNPDFYTLGAGSTLITLKQDFINNLLPGTYHLKATYSDGGEATTTFVIQNVLEKNPKTGDQIMLSIILGSISTICLFCVGLFIKKTNYSYYK